MANVIRKATNKFTKGLVMDFSPENTKNEVLTYALNATLLTFNGNELSLQNDMGNGRVETAFLPEGYIPVGTCEYGGIIYIVSYNPLEDKSQIGCFPSPERNISREEMGCTDDVLLSWEDFLEYLYVESDDGDYIKNGDDYIIAGEHAEGVSRYDKVPNGNLTQVSQKVLLRTSNLNPGDKFIVSSNDGIYEEQIQDMLKWDESAKKFVLIDNPYIKISLVSIHDSGKITYLNSDVRLYEVTNDGNIYSYYILGQNMSNLSNLSIDIDSYRNVLSSGYNVFKSKTSGKLAILAELITIDSYSVTHEITTEEGNPNKFKVNIYPEVHSDPNNANIKLKYHYLAESLGYLLYFDDTLPKEEVKNKVLFETTDNTNIINETPLNLIYNIYDDELKEALKNQTLTNTNFSFPLKDYYTDAYDADDFIKSIELGYIEIPEVIVENAWDLPFKYNYTIIPCMDYGKLPHLSVTNTIDFNKMRDFDKSHFDVWKYRIDGTELRLTFGAEVYDTFLTNKVDAIVLEFYDHRGFAGSLEISGKKAYSGKFTKLIQLNASNSLSNYKINENTQSNTFTRNVNITKNGKKYYYNEQEVMYYNDAEGWYKVTKTTEDATHLWNENTEKYEEVKVATHKWNEETKEYEAATEDATHLWNENTEKYEEVKVATHKLESFPEMNDCGVLYANLVYIVKPYFRQTTKDGYNFIEKSPLVLFTLPIYNEYYYLIDNFNLLKEPALDLVLTYKLEEDEFKSELKVYNHSNLTDGYFETDYNNISNYLSNNYKNNSSLTAVRYYKYSGESKLNIEVGLHQNYSDYGLTYDPKINERFNCTLKLLSSEDKDKIYSVSHDKTNKLIDNILNLNELDPFNSSIEFYETTKLPLENISSYNFLNAQGTTYIPINYQFIIGYKIDIVDITNMYIPVTTICALCHKKDDGTYNYEDFGIYENDGKYLSKSMFFNEGTHETEVFGVCLQMQTDETVLKQCHLVDSVSTEASRITTPGKLNSGNPLKLMLKHVGKLTFCQPHVHGFSEVNGTNILEGRKDGNLYCIPPALGKWKVKNAEGAEDTYGTAAMDLMLRIPLYNLSLNTKNSIEYNSEFISTIDYEVLINQAPNQLYIFGINFNKIDEKNYITDWKEVDPNTNEKWKMRKFTGITGEEVANFNKCLLNTMKSVYAYNPDYDSMLYKVGQVKILDYTPKFNSNIISIDSFFSKNSDSSDFDLNDYIYFGSINVKAYLTDLYRYADIKADDYNTKIKFLPNLRLCGKESEPYLLTSLTYNTPVPEDDICRQLDLLNYEPTVIRESEGKVTIINLVYNKNTLYQWHKNYLIPLDVSNYKISSSDGTLSINNKSFEISKELEQIIKFSESDYTNLAKEQPITRDVPDTDTDIKLSFIVLAKYSNNVELVAVDETNQNVTDITDHTISQDTDNKNVLDVTITTDKPVDKSYINIEYGIMSEKYDITEGNVQCQITKIEIEKDGKAELVSDDEVFDTTNVGFGTISIDLGTPAGTFIIHATVTLPESITVKGTYTVSDYTKHQKTSIYSKYDDYKYSILDNYTGSVLVGTTLTLNDLIYEPNKDGHRLFVKNDLCKFTSSETNRSKIYYRPLDLQTAYGYKTDDNLYKNCLCLYSGPCFATVLNTSGDASGDTNGGNDSSGGNGGDEVLDVTPTPGNDGTSEGKENFEQGNT